MEVESTTREKKIPHASHFLSVEYPGNVVNEQNAIETLGGIETLTKAVNENQPTLCLNFSPGEWNSHPIYGDRVYSSKLLLRVRTPKSNTDESAIEHEIVGVVPYTYKFRALSDFRYTFKDIQPQDTGLETFSLPDSQHFHMVPKTFIKVDHPQSYKFQSNPGYNYTQNADGTAQYTRRWKERALTKNRTTINLKEMPTGPAHAFSATHGDQELYDRLTRLFESRPIWIAEAIKANVPAESHRRLKIVLPFVAYYFINGPWQRAWVRFGYDPRVDKESRIYQCLDFRSRVAKRLSTETRELIEQQFKKKLHSTVPFLNQHRIFQNLQEKKLAESAKKKQKTTGPTHTFADIPISGSFVFQLVDVQIEEVQKLLKSTTSFTLQYGWFSAATFRAIREQMNKRFMHFFAEMKHEMTARDSSGNTLADGITQTEWDEMSAPQLQDYEMSSAEEVVEDDSESREDDAEDEENANEMRTIDFLSQLMKNTQEENNNELPFLSQSNLTDATRHASQNMFEDLENVEEFEIL